MSILTTIRRLLAIYREIQDLRRARQAQRRPIDDRRADPESEEGR